MLSTILIFLCFSIIFWWKKRKVRHTRQPPVHPGVLPLIGHLHLIMGNYKRMWRVLKKIAHECIELGHATTLHFGSRCYYVITDPDDCLTVANSCLQKDTIYEFSKPLFGEGLITAPVHIWKEHRKLLNPTFNLKFLNGFLYVFNKHGKELVREIEIESKYGPFNPEPYLKQNEMKNIYTLGLDFSKYKVFQEKYENTLESILKIYIERLQKFWLHYEFIWNRSNLKKKHDKYVKTLHDMMHWIIQEKRQINNCYISKDWSFTPFVDIFFDFKRKTSNIFSDTAIRDHMNTLMAAGHDTISVALSYIFLMIGSYQNVQDRIYRELLEVFDNMERDVEKEDLIKLIYLDAVIKETMRIYPIVPMIGRYIDKDIKLKHYTLLAGNSCALMIYGIHRNPIWGSDADQFKPDRWLDSSSLPQNSYRFLPFSLGKRICIGKSYAMMSLKVTLVYILRNYRIAGDHTKLKNKLGILLRPDSGHFISITPRK
ncbi:unnamed protein product [Parnassius apollo]|uniref:(apollo) hypothetical protein n=1 Tax=Parnassius apollo TaxID=110799 RepID=A0A8S3XAU3_PARAO|nr:unnamed protein product [Parnassius apollo]